jgi:probable rRNA maturation factor
VSTHVEVQIACEATTLPTEEQLQQWAELALQDHELRALAIRVVDKAESQQLNHDYRGKDKPTNVLSFPFAAPPGMPLDYLGDLAICADVVQAEATEQNKGLQAHWAHMVIHGVLHLRGYDHQSEQEAKQMENLERLLLEELGYADPYSA